MTKRRCNKGSTKNALNVLVVLLSIVLMQASNGLAQEIYDAD